MIGSELTLHFWIVLVGALCAVSCALLGCFLVLRRMSMMGDAISHAVLPGIAIAYLLTEARSSMIMFLGAAAAGVLTALFIQWVQRFGKVDRGAAMGVVFTTLFAVGLIIIVRSAERVDLDPGCVLYGAIELVPIDTVTVGGWRLPRAVLVLSGLLVLNVTIIALFFKELKISSFDPALATTLGINATAMHYLLMSLVAITTVACFEAIGSILVIAMLIVPAAAAYLLTRRLLSMLIVSAVLGALSAGLGHWSALTIPTWFTFDGVHFRETQSSGMMAVAAGALFVLALLLSPRDGVLVRVLRRWRLSLRIVNEDVLGMLYRSEESGMPPPAPVDLLRMLEAPRWRVIIGLRMLDLQNLIAQHDGTLALTERGRVAAKATVRGHRLWESYLYQNLPLDVAHVHRPAEKLEHITDAQMRERLAAATNQPTHDPHGTRVPQ